MRAWRAYTRRNDALVQHQGHTAGLLHPMRIAPGYFRRVEGHGKRFVRLMRKTGL
ncbi:hypothetical protein [Actinoplanes ianthinogenes]|uniref:hypothetical protein n=1 Tax=Actinoplanes ianthinogenes TaxID=122358 RepID=UPI0016705DDA|nr:hypothetical protein [Actinoplanes ianthinogenes]